MENTNHTGITSPKLYEIYKLVKLVELGEYLKRDMSKEKAELTAILDAAGIKNQPRLF